MTLGEYPDKVDPKYLISLDAYNQNEFDIGRFRDISSRVAWTASICPAAPSWTTSTTTASLTSSSPPATRPSRGLLPQQGRRHVRGSHGPAAHLDEQGVGGFNCVQTDYNNDGNLDVFIPRGAWLPWPVRPSLLRNNGDGTFTDVTDQAGLLDPVNSPSATWADYDNDGFLDLFVCCERQPNRLYHNEGNGTFEEVAAKAGFRYDGRCCKGAAWIDYDNDGWPDLFVCNSGGPVPAIPQQPQRHLH